MYIIIPLPSNITQDDANRIAAKVTAIVQKLLDIIDRKDSASDHEEVAKVVAFIEEGKPYEQAVR